MSTDPRGPRLPAPRRDPRARATHAMTGSPDARPPHEPQLASAPSPREPAEPTPTTTGPSFTRAQLDAVSAVGYTYYQNDQLDEAFVVFEVLSALDPSFTYALRGLAAISLAQGDARAALRAADRARATSPDDLGLTILRAQALLAVGQTASAAEELRRALTGHARAADLDDRAASDLHLARELLASLDAP